MIPHGAQVGSIGEQLVFLGASHGWGPGKLTDAQVEEPSHFGQCMHMHSPTHAK